VLADLVALALVLALLGLGAWATWVLL